MPKDYDMKIKDVYYNEDTHTFYFYFRRNLGFPIDGNYFSKYKADVEKEIQYVVLRLLILEVI